MRGSIRWFAALVWIAVVPVCPARPAAQTGIMADLRDREYNNVINNLIDVVQAMPLEHFSFRPLPELRTFGEIVGHIVGVQDRLCGAVLPDAPEPSDWEKEPDVGKLIDAFWASVALCDRAFDGMTESTAKEIIQGPPPRRLKTPRTGPLVAMLGHTSRETGKLVTYLRLKGIVPPPVGLHRGREGRPARRRQPGEP